MVTFNEWKNFKAKKRDYFLGYEADSDEDEDIFSEIHPSLRIRNFEEEVPNWKELQEAYEKKGKFTKWSTSSRTSLAGDLDDRINQIKEEITSSVIKENNKNIQSMKEELDEQNKNIQLVIQALHRIEQENQNNRREITANYIQQHPNPDLLRISGQSNYLQKIIEPFASVTDPDYEVFATIDVFGHTLRRFFIQPHGAEYGGDFNDYERSIRHFVDPVHSPIASIMLAGTTMSVTIHGLIDGVYESFTFKKFPQSMKSLNEWIDTIYAEEGSDFYKRLRRNITGVSINVVNPYSGGCRTKTEILWGKLYHYNKIYDYSCFYACIRNIWKANEEPKKYQYNTMRRMLTSSDHDRPVSTEWLPKAEKVFGVKFIVLGPELPEIIFAKPPKSQKTYQEMQGKYLIKYHTIYYDGFDMELTETSVEPLEFIRRSNSIIVVLNNKEYHLLCLADNHYSSFVSINRPAICIKCGSNKHLAEDTDKDIIRLECLERIKDLLTVEDYEKAYPKITSIVFDFETIVYKEILFPYAVAWCVNIEGLNNTSEYHCEIGPNCDALFLDSIRKVGGIKTLIGYNSSRFDNFFIVKRLLKEGVELNSSNTTIHNNQILKLSCRDLRVWDLCQFTKCSLNQACEAFGLENSKLSFDHKEAQKLFDEYGWDFIDKIGRDKIKDYNIRDTKLTLDLFKLVKESLHNITGLNPLLYMTISQLAYKHLTVDNLARGIKLEKIHISYNEIFDSIPAGRVQMFKDKGRYDKNYVQIDANGLYQYICLNYDMPDGEIIEYDDYHRASSLTLNNKLHLVLCDVDQTHLRIKLVGQKVLDDRINWNRHKVFNCWLWGEEIKELEANNCKVVKKRTLVWSKKVRCFEVMNIYKENRLKEKLAGNDGGVIDSMNKLLSNANTGKCYQRNKNEEWAIVSTLSQSENFRIKHKDPTFDTTGVEGRYFMQGDKLEESDYLSKPRHIGARIYAMARLYMFQTIKNIMSICYMDTDGFIMLRSEYDKRPDLQESNDLGKFKIEAYGDRLYLCSLKNYALCNTKSDKPVCILEPHKSKLEYKECNKKFWHNKYRMKSYHNGDEWVSDHYKGLYVNEDMYKALIEDQEVKTVTERIVKKFVRYNQNDGYVLSTLTSRREERLII